jgi:molybdenum transport protein
VQHVPNGQVADQPRCSAFPTMNCGNGSQRMCHMATSPLTRSELATTTAASGSKRVKRCLRPAAKEAGGVMALAGADVIECVASGTGLQTGGLLLAARGSAAALHSGWKVAQTLLETAGGIATAAQAIVEAVQQVNSEVVVACTRKSLPGTRALSIKAVLSGGAVSHRLGLSETILVFAQHRAFTGGASLSAIIDRLRRRVPEKKIVAEADTLAEAVAIADGGADIVQFDKASPAEVAALRRHCQSRTPRPLVAAAGGINRW